MENKIRMMMLLTRNGKLLHLSVWWLAFLLPFFRLSFLVFAIVERVELQGQELTRVNIYFLTR